jgi:hypothetical protein
VIDLGLLFSWQMPLARRQLERMLVYRGARIGGRLGISELKKDSAVRFRDAEIDEYSAISTFRK